MRGRRRGERERGGNSEAKELELCNCCCTVSGFQLHATCVVSRENCTAGYAVSRNTVAKISRVFYRAFLRIYLFHGWSDSQPGRYTL